MPDSLCLITLGSVIMQIKLISFLRLIVNSCIAELDLFKLTCKTLIVLFCSRDSGILFIGNTNLVQDFKDLERSG